MYASCAVFKVRTAATLLLVCIVCMALITSPILSARSQDSSSIVSAWGIYRVPYIRQLLTPQHHGIDEAVKWYNLLLCYQVPCDGCLENERALHSRAFKKSQLRVGKRKKHGFALKSRCHVINTQQTTIYGLLSRLRKSYVMYPGMAWTLDSAQANLEPNCFKPSLSGTNCYDISWCVLHSWLRQPENFGKVKLTVVLD